MFVWHSIFLPHTPALLVFTATVMLLLYIYIGYPLLLTFVALFREKRRYEPGYCPRMTVLIAAYNEERHIGRKIAETLTLEYPADLLDILVVSDGSIDRTDEIVRSLNHPRVRVLRVDRRMGKTHAQNEGVRHCKGEVIVFSDVTAIYHPKALLYLACNYQDPAVGAVSGRYKYFDPERKSPTGVGSVAFWNYENMIKRLQSRISTLTGCSGCIYSVRKAIYTPLPDTACSDLEEPLCVVRKRYRVVFEDRALAHEETTKSTSEEFGMRVRVATRGMRGVLTARDLLKFWKYGWVSFQLISHKILRWLVPCCLALLLVSNAFLLDSVLFRYLFLLQLAFYLFGAISAFVPLHRHWRALGVPLYFCTLNIAALFGLFEIFRGNRYVVWNTVRK